MIIQLAPEHLQMVKTILKKYIPKRKVLVFGSRVTSNFKPHSDLDLCILGTRPLSLKQIAILREAFAESDLPMRVDLVDWATSTPQFQDIIKNSSYSV